MGWVAAVGARGQIITNPPGSGGGSGGTFGPIVPLAVGTLEQRAQAVRDGTAPVAVVHPGGSPTVVNPGDSIATKITTAGAGGTLWFTKGTHVNTSQRLPLAGQTWVLESGAGYTRTTADTAVIDGQNANFPYHVFATNVDDVTIRGGMFIQQGNSTGDANTASSAIFNNLGSGWLLEDVIIKDNRNRGLTLGSGDTARRCYITNNGRYGITANSGDAGGGTRVEKCQVSFNNSRLLPFGNDAGGSKFIHINDVVVDQCWFHDNFGFGIWWDMQGNAGANFGRGTNNVSETNRRSGLFVEGVDGGSSLVNNYVRNNGWDTASIGGQSASYENNVQIRITHSDSSLGSGVRGNVELNDVDFTMAQTNVAGPALLLWNHQPPHPNVMRNWDIHNNRFWFRANVVRRIGGQDTQTDPGTQLWDADCDFFDNEYHIGAGTAGTQYFQWGSGTGTGSNMNYTTWQTHHPGDNLALETL